MDNLRRLSLIALGGALGSVARFGLGLWLQPFHIWEPTGILLINVTGSFVIAVVNFLSEPIEPIPGWRLGTTAREFLMVGLCGGFTTFSSFCYLVYAALSRWRWGDALLNLGLSHALCLAAAWLGFHFCRVLGRRMHPHGLPTEEVEGERTLSEEENA
ncbi:MAG TPA: CrcB family protein [Chthoniobacterales bacterium]